jgi:hypothetical protein
LWLKLILARIALVNKRPYSSTDRALVFGTSDGGSIPSKGTTGLAQYSDEGSGLIRQPAEKELACLTGAERGFSAKGGQGIPPGVQSLNNSF